MGRAHVSLLSSLLVATLVLPAAAQTPSGAPPTDSAAAAAPKKKGRFGGLMDKAKKVAANKSVQDAAKGAATGVACTVVPGAAAVSMATGSGPCANAGLAALVTKGGAASAASAVASGAAGGAASKALGKMTGAKGAAASGALGALGGKGGLSNAASAAAASAITRKGGAAMTGNAASMAAAQAAAANMLSGSGAASLKKGSAPKGGPSEADVAGAMSAMSAAMGQMNKATAGASKVETVDFRELKALLPNSLRGMPRTEATGQKNGAMGIQISTAEGLYSAAGGNSVTLTITDIGSVTGMAAATTYAWATTEIDRESNSGYEKTTTFKGYKAIEQYDKQSHTGELSVLVEGRFVVGATGSNVDMDSIRAAVGSVDLHKLAGMKNKGVK